MILCRLVLGNSAARLSVPSLPACPTGQRGPRLSLARPMCRLCASEAPPTPVPGKPQASSARAPHQRAQRLLWCHHHAECPPCCPVSPARPALPSPQRAPRPNGPPAAGGAALRAADQGSVGDRHRAGGERAPGLAGAGPAAAHDSQRAGPADGPLLRHRGESPAPCSVMLHCTLHTWCSPAWHRGDLAWGAAGWCAAPPPRHQPTGPPRAVTCNTAALHLHAALCCSSPQSPSFLPCATSGRLPVGHR